VSLDVSWHAGWTSPKHDPAPEIQIHWYDDSTVIMRQNRSVHYEAPFLFLFFGEEAALLVDTGATAEPEYFPLRATVDELLAAWTSARGLPAYRLIVAHTHGHGDHVAADGQFADRPSTTVVAAGLAAVRDYYGFSTWPDGLAAVDLGGRILDVIPGPGHQQAATVFYDRATGLLLTGDTLCRGRLYVRDWPDFVATVERLLDFCATRPVSHVLGCHIEMSGEPGRDYMLGQMYQPDEPPLELDVADLVALRDATREIGGRPGRHAYPNFIVVVLEPPVAA
jgi:glyoxylase-like metal-dependent hydrolase (beta-lactamase superfamily II)